MSQKTIQLVAFISFVSLILVGSQQYMAQAWGFWGHKRVNRMAVFTLPNEMMGFYKEHIEYLTEHAPDPDKRRYAVEGEAERHFIDVDHYGEYPFEMVPRKWDDAVAKYTEDTLRAYGIVPWHLEVMLARLTKAFKNRNSRRILQLSAEVGHYLGDAHVPLHTTVNYNGQLTNQKGIHGFWESRIPELYGENFDYWTGKATHISRVNDYVWQTVLDSHAALDSVLVFERELNERYPSDQKYCYETRGQQSLRMYCEAYTLDYATMLDGMVERRMRKAIVGVGSFWYTAWINAGQPDLTRLDEALFTEEDAKKREELNKAYEAGKANNSVKGRGNVHY